jgi:hypothetical protein
MSKLHLPISWGRMHEGVLKDPVWQSWSFSACWSRCYLCTKVFLWSCEGRDGSRSSTESWALTMSKSPQYHWPSTLSLPFSSSLYDNFLFFTGTDQGHCFPGLQMIMRTLIYMPHMASRRMLFNLAGNAPHVGTPIEHPWARCPRWNDLIVFAPLVAINQRSQNGTSSCLSLL